MQQESLARHSAWLDIGKQILSFAIGIVVAAFVLGSVRQKVQDLVKWKDETAPRIEKMDRGGSISFENFKTNYDKEQAKQYDRIQKLEAEVSHLDNVELRLNRLEKKIGEDP